MEEAPLTNSSLDKAKNESLHTEQHKAWYLLALLLRFGRPARPAELASRCVLFPAPPDFVKHLCSIPNSPIFLTNDWFVTPSLVALVAFEQFMSNLNVIGPFVPRVELASLGPRRVWEDVARTYCRRPKRLGSEFGSQLVARKRAVLCYVDENEEIQIPLLLSSGYQSDCTKVHLPMGDYISKRIELDTHPGDTSIMELESDSFCRVVWKDPFSLHAGLLSYELKNIEQSTRKETSIFEHVKENQYVHKPEFAGSEARTCEIKFRSRTCFTTTSCPEIEEQSLIPPVEAENVGHACKVNRVQTVKDERIEDDRGEKPLIDSSCYGGKIEYMVPAANTAQTVMSHDTNRMNLARCIDMITPLDKEKTAADVVSKAVLSPAKKAVLSPPEHSLFQKQLMKSSSKSKNSQKNALDLKQQVLCKALSNSEAARSPIEQLQSTREKKTSMKHKLRQNCDKKVHAKQKAENSKEKRDKPIANALNDLKPLPNFECFTIKEEEGSGGYGTVYKAQRRNDGVTFAIKCPHANANRYHVHNEMKMLERLGGKNFVIKYEGSFKSGNSEYLVLEHVEHDRPEVLKKEIDLFQLQWYGYCMFRALVGLHKQGIVHRDVKPGNFLFSRKVNKGYLIDFNLAMDLHQKCGTTDKAKLGSVSFNQVPIAHSKSFPPTNDKSLVSKSLEAINQDAGKGSKRLLLPKNLKRKAEDQTNAFSDFGGRSMMKSQGADGSGITSAKDATSTRTPSAERLREPIPCQGRKELISLVHKAMQAPNYEEKNAPASKRKRIAALPGKVDRKLVYYTPMPLHSAGIAIAGAGLLKNKGDGKQKKEGPCVGTKGFRAPEVLFRSAHQCPKVDIWSAGVTLLYLMTGRTPFTGEPEQNIMEIARLRGSEDLWEVAKLHNRESSFPEELFDRKYLPSTKLRDWCKQNTKRPEFFEVIPRSLFDLVDKCLTVNPRLRISAEEALRHEFFAPCHEGLRKERLLRKGLSLDSGTTHLLHRQSEP